MKRSTKIAGGSIAVLLLAAGGTLFFSQSRVSSLLKAALGIETAAEELLTEAVGTDVTIESIDVSLAAGEMTIRGLAVANPDGFHTEHALEADEIRVAMELGSLLEDTVVVREIAVEKPLVTYELGPEGSNLEAIQRNVDSFAAPGEGPRGGAPARPAARILIKNLYIRDGRVAASAVFLEGKSWKAPLPDIHLENISSGEGGTAAAGIIEEITSEIVTSARQSVAPIRELAGEVSERLAGSAAKLVEDVKRKIEKGAGSARESLEQGSESAREALEQGSEFARETLKQKAETARETLEKGAESAQEALGEGAESTREALEKGTESARKALGKGTDKVKKTLGKLLGKRTE